MFEKTKSKIREEVIDPIRSLTRIAISALYVAIFALLVAVSR